MVKQIKKGRPRDKQKVVHSPADGSILPHCRIDAQGNYFFSFKDDNGKWIKRNLGRGDGWYANYLRREAEFVKKETYTNLKRKEGQDSLLGDITFNTTEEELKKILNDGFTSKQFINFLNRMNIRDINIPDSWIYAKTRELIKKKPKTAAKQLGIPYERLIGLDDTPNYTLNKIGNNYFDKPKFKDINLDREKKKELDKVRKSWDWFVQVIQVSTIREIEKMHIKKWYDTLYTEFLGSNQSTTWLNGFMERPKRVLNAALLDFNNSVDINNVVNRYRAKCKSITNVVKNLPKFIQPEDFQKLLEVSSVEEKAMWWLSLNCAYYSVDIVSLTMDKIDLVNKTTVFTRGKTGKYRCACLWDDTVIAIQDYLEATNDRVKNRKELFVSVYGKPYIPDRIRKKFAPVRSKANLHHYEHNHFRDSFETAAMVQSASSDMIDIVMGHTLRGSKKDYADKIVAYPKLAKDTCMLVYDHYFPSKKDSVKT